MSSTNPYQAPATDIATKPPVAGGTPSETAMGIWRDGKYLVMHKKAALPDLCVKSNEPTKRRLRRQLYWHHPAVYLSILISILVYIILALVLRKSATVDIGLSDEWFARRRRAMLVGWGGSLLGVALFGVGIAVADRTAGPALMILGPILLVLSMIWGVVRARMVAPKKITDEYVWLKGINQEYLAEFPPLPHT